METNPSTDTRRRTSPWIVAALLGLGLVILVVWVNSPAAVPIIGAGLHQERENVIELEVSSCHGELTVSKVETDEEIQVLVRDNRFRIRLYGDGCADVVPVELDQPLNGRILIDKTTGSMVEVRTDV